MDLVNQLLNENSGGRVKHLSWMAFGVSLIHFGIMWAAFILSRGMDHKDIYPVPVIFLLLYIASLLVYVIVKDALRLKHPKQNYIGKRRGENFIVLWVFSGLVMGAIEFFSHGYFIVPESMWETCAAAVGIGGISSTLKIIQEPKRDICPDEDEVSNEKAPCDDAKRDEV